MSAFAIMDPAMASALLAGRKTQLRVLAGSPLSRVLPGDRVPVREASIPGRSIDGQVYATSLAKAEFVIFADGWRQHRDGSVVHGRRPTDPDHRWITAIQMPRWASRATLLIRSRRTESLQQLTRRDVVAEGGQPLAAGLLWRWPRPVPGVHLSARRAFAHYWDLQHGSPGQRWGDDPMIEVLDFDIELSSASRLHPGARAKGAHDHSPHSHHRRF